MSGRRPIVFGEVLFDRFPDGSIVLGGAPFNVAWHLQAFGRAPLLVTRVGDDALGARAREAMSAWGFDLSGVQVDTRLPTGTVDVELAASGPRFDIRADVAYDGIDAAALPDVIDGALVYHGTLALRGATSRRAFDRLVQRTALPRFLDVNLRPPWWHREEVEALMRGADWLKLNDDELDQLSPAPPPGGDRVTQLLDACGLRLLLLTRGAQGAELIGPDGRARAAPPPSDHVVDAVGAGDGFASVALVGLLENWPLATILLRAQAFASAIVAVRGAVVQDPSFYERTTATWNEAS